MALIDELTVRANEIYVERKGAKHPFRAPEMLAAAIRSDQVYAVIEVLAEQLEGFAKRMEELGDRLYHLECLSE